ncbi:MAG: hypothetical protein H6779_01730 [Candidatus Nomurabacteria bacterium]|nr:hypothetical protein [Candidatus Nomurabacteria bacterium]USN88148.1 MAG: hypothetical protein H6779_01730 [Candidatus Nomurabacteria bacterium]
MTKNYSMVSYLSGEDFKKVRSIQKELSKLTGSQKCLVDWLPHLTVGTGITLDDEQLVRADNLFNEATKKVDGFKVRAEGFGGWDNGKGAIEGKITPYVIYLKVEINDNLRKMFNILKQQVTDGFEVWLPRIEDYKPHITLAFADLDEVGYQKGLEYVNSLKDFSLDINISHFSLTECYGMGNMESVEYKRYYLS